VHAACPAVRRAASSDDSTAGSWTESGLDSCTAACNSGQVRCSGLQQKVHIVTHTCMIDFSADTNISGAGYRQTPAEAAAIPTGAAQQLPDSLQVRDSVFYNANNLQLRRCKLRCSVMSTGH